MSWKRDEVRSLAERIFSYSKTEECEVSLVGEADAYTRFAANDVMSAGAARDLLLTVISRGGGRSGVARVSDTDPEVLKRAVARSEELMALAPVDPEFVEALGPQKYPEIRSFDEATARAKAEDRRAGVKAALDRARAGGMNASGFFQTTARWSAIANKKGKFGFFASTEASYSTTFRTSDGTGSGWAGIEAPRLSDLRPADLVARAAKKAETSAKPRDLEPGRYTVILEPRAVADLISNLVFSLSQRAADEGRTFLSKPGGGTRVGEKLFADSVTLRSDPFDPRIAGRAWGVDGLPARPTTWVEKGVVKALSVDRYGARKTGKEPLPYSGSLVMEGGAGTVDDLVAGAGRALLVTRFWYIRAVNPYNVQLTGLTRDGVWLVEKGKVVAPVINLRFNDSPVNLLKNAEALSTPESTGSMVVPAIRAADFHFTSKSDAV